MRWLTDFRPARVPMASRVAGLGAVGCVLLLVAGVLLLLRVADALVPKTAIQALEDRDYPAPAPTAASGEPSPPPITDVQNVLVVGIDSREGLTEQQLQALGTEDDGSRATDTIMWVQYLPAADEVRMLSFPRDLRVAPATGGSPVKINALHVLGGPELLVSTIEELVGDDLDHYVEVSLAGFLELGEAVGGVEVCIQDKMYDEHAGVNLPAGCQVLDATDAAGFVRARMVVDEFGHAGYGRAARQQYYIRQAVGKVVTAGTLTSPTRVRALLDVARESVVVDDRFSTTELLRFANTFRSFESDRIVGTGVPVVAGGATIDGQYFDLATDEADDVYAAIRYGTPLPTDDASDAVTASSSSAGSDTGVAANVDGS